MKKSDRITALGALLSGVGICATGVVAVVNSRSESIAPAQCQTPVIIIDRSGQSVVPHYLELLEIADERQARR